MKSEYDVVICGAGIAGISAAYYLTQDARFYAACGVFQSYFPVCLIRDRSISHHHRAPAHERVVRIFL